MKIVASQELGNLGPRKSEPTLFRWQWYHHVPSLALWVVIFMLLVLVKGNRNRQAWLILLPLLAVTVISRMIPRLFLLSPATVEAFASFSVSIAAAWAVVWLLSHWLAKCHATAGFFLALMAMLMVGGLSYASIYGISSARELVYWWGPYGTCVLALLLAMMLSGFNCRRQYRPGRFAAWLLLWTIALPIAFLPVVFVIPMALAVAFTAFGLLEFVMILVVSLFLGGLLGGALYLLNLPFLFLAVRCPFYRNRFHNAFRLKGVRASAYQE